MPRLTMKALRQALDVELETVWYRLVCKIATIADRQADMAIAANRQTDQIQQLEQLAAQQAEVIAALTAKLSELAGDHTALCRAVEDLSDEETLSHQWLDRQQSRIVALESSVKDLKREIRDGDYATLEEVAQLRNKVTTHEPQVIADAIRNAHNATMRMDIHSKWISQLFDRLNEDVKE